MVGIRFGRAEMLSLHRMNGDPAFGAHWTLLLEAQASLRFLGTRAFGCGKMRFSYPQPGWRRVSFGGGEMRFSNPRSTLA